MMSNASVQTTPLTLTIANDPKNISPDLFGIFFEDLNYAADGGLYAELIQNRSFEYKSTEQSTWNQLSFWELIQRGPGKGHLGVGELISVHPNNPHYAVLEVHTLGDGVGVANSGFDGIAIQKGETYDVSFLAAQLYMNTRWGGDSSVDNRPMPVTIRLENRDGKVLAETSLQIVGKPWKRYDGELLARETEPHARFVLLAGAPGGIVLDEVSLFPRKTFRNRKNGLRADLAQTIADLKPRFVRFPGGCLAHGVSVGNMYRWKHTIGPVEQRKQQMNLWGYHQTAGLGYFEYFQFCEDIGAKPLPVVPAGVSCQNSSHVSGTGQQCIPMDEMPAYVQEVLDLIEYANGPVTSKWGSLRAAAGHPQPFHLQYLGVGNEEHITPAFKERFAMIHRAIKAKHPEITVIGTVGPASQGFDYETGWKFANEINLEMVDEHYYVQPDWFWTNLNFYDTYDRSKSKVYLGEYAAHDEHRNSTLRSALADAAYMTALERNGDVVALSSYAPLLAKQGHTQWRPDMIYFDNTTISPTINYYVQKLFAHNAGDSALPVAISDAQKYATTLACSCVRDSESGDVILKIVSRLDAAIDTTLDLSSLGNLHESATCTVISGDPMAQNEFARPASVLPVESTIRVTSAFAYRIPAHSLSVLRIKPKAAMAKPFVAAQAIATPTTARLTTAPAEKSFHAWAPTPPMGWNSWDCFGTAVTEAQTRENADYMAEKLLRHGWRLITVDIQWYEADAKGHVYRDGAPLTMDSHGRLLPSLKKFPSAANNSGFKPLADYVHAKRLTFGIHLMRGVPRQAVKEKTPILGTTFTAADIANTSDVCPWNPDMYGVDMSMPGAQAYYDSVFALIASWGVDFVKVDDLSRPYHDHEKEIEAIRKAIDKTGRAMVLSTSPGETPLSAADHVTNHANLWRISDDFWDNWKLLKDQFARCRNWAQHQRGGAYPDADMLALGAVRVGQNNPWTLFTHDEQLTHMTLWCIARSPLIFGGHLPKNDAWTLSLLTNDEVLAVNQHGANQRECSNDNGLIVWVSDVPNSPDKYAAVFNTRDAVSPADVNGLPISVRFQAIGLTGPCKVRDLWTSQDLGEFKAEFAPRIRPHASMLLRISPKR